MSLLGWKMLGLMISIIFGIVLFVVMMIFVNKNRSMKTEYDERQELLRGNGFKVGFYAGMAYSAILMILAMAEIDIPVNQEVIYFSVLFVMGVAMSTYDIFTGAYFGLNNSKGRFYFVMIVISVLNIIVPIRFIIDGSFIQNGTVTTSAVNLLCAVWFLLIGVECFIKNLLDKRAGAEDEES